MKKHIQVTRGTTESNATVALDFTELAADYRKQIKTPLPFLSHMLEHIAYRGGFTISCSLKLDEFSLTHLICEDLGLTFGRAIKEYVDVNYDEGIMGYGDAVGIIDEAMACAAVSFENRANFFFDSEVSIPPHVEGMESEDLNTFLDGFCQGACCTLHINLKKGQSGHHIYEAIFRALGTCLRNALAQDNSRAGKTAGVAGKIIFETKIGE